LVLRNTWQDVDVIDYFLKLFFQSNCLLVLFETATLAILPTYLKIGGISLLLLQGLLLALEL
jgi:hypothetical protein